MNNPYITQPQILFTPGKGDPYVTRLCDWIVMGEIPSDISIIGVPLSKSSISFSGAHTHPTVFRQLWSSFQTYNWDEDINFEDKLTAVDLGDVKMHITDILQCHENIREASRLVWKQYPVTTPIFIGGDHSITYPIITGLVQDTKKRMGLIQFDAHLDVRDTTYGGPSNGTPIRNLIEHGILLGENIVTIGLRSFANSPHYRKYAEEKGITLFSSNQVKQNGIQEILKQTMDYLQPKVDMVYVTFDIDVMDQSYVPGVPAIGPNGLAPQDVLWAAKTLGAWVKVKSMDMVCVDPTRDVRDMTTRIALHVFLEFISGRYMLKSKW
jgi:formiminoglutamase